MHSGMLSDVRVQSTLLLALFSYASREHSELVTQLLIQGAGRSNACKTAEIVFQCPNSRTD